MKNHHNLLMKVLKKIFGGQVNCYYPYYDPPRNYLDLRVRARQVGPKTATTIATTIHVSITFNIRGLVPSDVI